MRVSALLPLMAAAVSAATGASAKPDFYVSTAGRDSWTGTLATPNGRRTDGPFATVDRARRAVAARRAAGASGRTVVALRGGLYQLQAPLAFGPEDGGTVDAPVIYQAYAGERPVLSGGRRIRGFTRGADGRWTADLPDVAAGRWAFTQLFVGDSRRSRPRLPKQGYYFVAADSSPSPASEGKGWDRLAYSGDEINPTWRNLVDVEVLPFQIWAMSRFRLASVDGAARVATFFGQTSGTSWWASIGRGQRYLVENVYEALNTPGEWYLDRPSGKLTYLPRPGENPSSTDVIAPVLDELMTVKGDPAARRWVSNLHFKGIAFAHSNWVTPPTGHSFPQAEANLGGAVTLVGARDVTFEDCSVKHVGTYALDIGAACKRVKVTNCEFTDMAAGGLKIGTTSYSDDDEMVASHNEVRDCLIAHGGRMHPAGIGVWIGHSSYNTIAWNEIADFYYTGISVGWSWGYGPSNAHHNVLEHNHVHDIGQGVLSDMGATYTLGVAPGSIQRGNVFHDISAFGYGGWGIYFDEGTTGMLAENNVVYRTKSAGFHQHYGRENTVRNNVFAYGREAQVMRTRAEEHLSFTFERNLIEWSEGPLLGSNWSGSNYRLDNNLYWQVDRKPILFAGMSLADWRAKGQDEHSIIENPLFVDPAKGDFRLRPGSPAAKIGFVPFEVRAGRRGPAGKTAAPVAAVRAFPAPPPPPPPAPIVDDFETTQVGAKPAGAQVYEENATATIRVTDETASKGKHCLKFVDAPGQKAGYNPHMFYTPGFTAGVLKASFALRIEKGTHMYHEWRDANSPYRVGPSLWVSADGVMTAQGKDLIRVPWGEWFRVEITCGLGKKANGKYAVVLSLPGRTAPVKFDLTCDPAFGELQWFGFTGNADAAGVFYVDDLSVRPAP